MYNITTHFVVSFISIAITHSSAPLEYYNAQFAQIVSLIQTPSHRNGRSGKERESKGSQFLINAYFIFYFDEYAKVLVSLSVCLYGVAQNVQEQIVEFLVNPGLVVNKIPHGAGRFLSQVLVFF